jgi:CBS domain-containing protein
MSSRIHFSQIAGNQLMSASHESLGKVVDCVVRLVDGALPRVTGIVARSEGAETWVDAQDIESMDEDAVNLGVEKLDGRPFERRPGEVLLARDVVNRGVIDVEDARLVHVQDLLLEGESGGWHIIAVIPSPPTSLVGVLKRAFGQIDRSEEAIDWAHIEPLTGHVPTAGRRIPMLRLAELDPAEIADIVEQATEEEREEILDAVHEDTELEADVFEELDEEDSADYLRDRSDAETAQLLAEMEPDAAADVLMELEQARRRPVLDLLPSEQKRKVMSLLGHHPETAGGLMTTDFVALAADMNAASALAHIRGLEEIPRVMSDIFVVEAGRLRGSITLADLIRADTATRLGQFMEDDPVATYADADLPSVAMQMADFNLSSLAVVDDEGNLIGVITHDDLLEAMLPQDWRRRGRPEQAKLPAGTPARS